MFSSQVFLRRGGSPRRAKLEDDTDNPESHHNHAIPPTRRRALGRAARAYRGAARSAARPTAAMSTARGL
eukprot:3996019-Prymnesium_polylepis.1